MPWAAVPAAVVDSIVKFQKQKTDCLEPCVRFLLGYWKHLIKYIISSSWNSKKLFSSSLQTIFFVFVWTAGNVIAKNLNYKNIKKTSKTSTIWIWLEMAVKRSKKSIASQHWDLYIYWHKTDWLGEFRCLAGYGIWERHTIAHNPSISAEISFFSCIR